MTHAERAQRTRSGTADSADDATNCEEGLGVAVYIVRRLVAAFFILIGASFIVYMLMTQAGDPLAFTLAHHRTRRSEPP